MAANDKQEGGNHYKTDGIPEHWDLAIMYGWDPFQYQITKYLMRVKLKHDTPMGRLSDLKKAQHFLEKYIENWEHYDPELCQQTERSAQLRSEYRNLQMEDREARKSS